MQLFPGHYVYGNRSAGNLSESLWGGDGCGR